MNIMLLFRTWKHTAATLISAISMLTAVLGISFRVDGRYAHAGQVEQGFKTLERGQYQQERRYVQDKVWDLEAKKNRNESEERRLQELRRDLKDVEDQIRRLK
jgi:hypothetical protein